MGQDGVFVDAAARRIGGDTEVGRRETRRLEIADRPGDRLGVAARIREPLRAEIGEGDAAAEEGAEGDDPERGKRQVGLQARAQQDLLRQLLGTSHPDAGQQPRLATEACLAPEAMREVVRGQDERGRAGEASRERGEARVEPRAQRRTSADQARTALRHQSGAPF